MMKFLDVSAVKPGRQLLIKNEVAKVAK